MYCEKCGQPIPPGEHHVCSENQAPSLTRKRMINRPPVPLKTSQSLERTTLTLSGRHPDNLTIEDIISGRKSNSGLIKEVKNVFVTWKGFIRKPTKANSILLAVGLVVFLLWAWSKYAPGYYSSSSLKSTFSFLLATYTNIPARILHFSSLATLAVAFFPQILTGQTKKITAHFKSTLVLMKKILSFKKSKASYVGLISLGTGVFFANYLMRNNSTNKFMVCLSLGVTVLLSTTGLNNATFIRLSKGLINDVTRLIKIQPVVNKYKIVILLGFGSGLILSFIACLLRSIRSTAFTDHFAYYLGAVIVVVGMVLLFSTPKSSISAS